MEFAILASRTVLSKYATFSGRASRPEFWWWVLSITVILAITRLIDGVIIAPLLGFDTFQSGSGQPLSFLISLAVILPNIAVAMRRLHDIGKSGWWLLIALLPVIGFLVLIYFYIQPSDKGDNEFGPQQPLNAP
ncbi:MULTISPECIES: DUF805 domain-containing protein [Falsihalocynthiibacter]|uniref:DUF805 domain-containing protein n=1 Tax=Falsihalocynthiibacter TaxID=2854182 RepID=UPI003001CED9